MRLLVAEPECYSVSNLEALKDYGLLLHCTPHGVEQPEFDEIYSSITPEIVLLKLGISFGKKHLEVNPNLKTVVTPTTGLTHLESIVFDRVNVISLKGDTEFLNSVTSTAEHAWFLLLSAVRNNTQKFISKPTDSWSRTHYQDISQLSGKSLGIIGFGRLGKMIAKYGRGFNMSVMHNDIKSDIIDPEYEFSQFVSLESLFEHSDYIILSANYDDYQIINQKLLNNLSKPIDVLVNISRGELVDETAIIDALRVQKIKSYYTDVLDGDAVWSKDEYKLNQLYVESQRGLNIKITPHIGGYAKEAIKLARSRVIYKLLKELKNENNC
jgi:D-3-phosphoglycerate dehydrogenase / 2-oxoglutarate reductase